MRKKEVFFILIFFLFSSIAVAESIELGDESANEVFEHHIDKDQDVNYEKDENIERKVEGSYIVEFDDKSVSEKTLEQEISQQDVKTHEERLRSTEARIKEESGIQNTGNRYNRVLPGFSTENLSENEVEDLKSREDVKKVHPVYEYSIDLQDTPDLVNASFAYDKDLTGESVDIAVLDTGIDYTHPNFGGCTDEEFDEGDCKVREGYDFVNNDDYPMDRHGHGTHVASIAAGEEDLEGVAPKANLLGYKVLSQSGTGTTDDIIKGIETAVEEGSDVVVMSLGGPGNPDDAISQTANTAVDEGVILTTSAGNDGGYESITSPGTAEDVITVASTDKDLETSGFSSGGPVIHEEELIIKPDITAPGEDICAAQAEAYGDICKENYAESSGTSMSNPVVAGAAALMLDKESESPEEVKRRLVQSARVLNDETLYDQGGGFLDINRLFGQKNLDINTSHINLGRDRDPENLETFEVKVENNEEESVSLDADIPEAGGPDHDETFSDFIYPESIDLGPGEEKVFEIGLDGEPADGLYYTYLFLKSEEDEWSIPIGFETPYNNSVKVDAVTEEEETLEEASVSIVNSDGDIVTRIAEVGEEIFLPAGDYAAWVYETEAEDKNVIMGEEFNLDDDTRKKLSLSTEDADKLEMEMTDEGPGWVYDLNFIAFTESYSVGTGYRGFEKIGNRSIYVKGIGEQINGLEVQGHVGGLTHPVQNLCEDTDCEEDFDTILRRASDKTFMSDWNISNYQEDYPEKELVFEPEHSFQRVMNQPINLKDSSTEDGRDDIDDDRLHYGHSFFQPEQGSTTRIRVDMGVPMNRTVVTNTDDTRLSEGTAFRDSSVHEPVLEHNSSAELGTYPYVPRISSSESDNEKTVKWEDYILRGNRLNTGYHSPDEIQVSYSDNEGEGTESTENWFRESYDLSPPYDLDIGFETRYDLFSEIHINVTAEENDEVPVINHFEHYDPSFQDEWSVGIKTENADSTALYINKGDGWEKIAEGGQSLSGTAEIQESEKVDLRLKANKEETEAVYTFYDAAKQRDETSELSKEDIEDSVLFQDVEIEGYTEVEGNPQYLLNIESGEYSTVTSWEDSLHRDLGRFETFSPICSKEEELEIEWKGTSFYQGDSLTSEPDIEFDSSINGQLQDATVPNTANELYLDVSDECDLEVRFEKLEDEEWKELETVQTSDKSPRIEYETDEEKVRWRAVIDDEYKTEEKTYDVEIADLQKPDKAVPNYKTQILSSNAANIKIESDEGYISHEDTAEQITLVDNPELNLEDLEWKSSGTDWEETNEKWVSENPGSDLWTIYEAEEDQAVEFGFTPEIYGNKFKIQVNDETVYETDKQGTKTRKGYELEEGKEHNITLSHEPDSGLSEEILLEHVKIGEPKTNGSYRFTPRNEDNYNISVAEFPEEFIEFETEVTEKPEIKGKTIDPEETEPGEKVELEARVNAMSLDDLDISVDGEEIDAEIDKDETTDQKTGEKFNDTYCKGVGCFDSRAVIGAEKEFETGLYDVDFEAENSKGKDNETGLFLVSDMVELTLDPKDSEGEETEMDFGVFINGEEDFLVGETVDEKTEIDIPDLNKLNEDLGLLYGKSTFLTGQHMRVKEPELDESSEHEGYHVELIAEIYDPFADGSKAVHNPGYFNTTFSFENKTYWRGEEQTGIFNPENAAYVKCKDFNREEESCENWETYQEEEVPLLEIEGLTDSEIMIAEAETVEIEGDVEKGSASEILTVTDSYERRVNYQRSETGLDLNSSLSESYVKEDLLFKEDFESEDLEGSWEKSDWSFNEKDDETVIEPDEVGTRGLNFTAEQDMLLTVAYSSQVDSLDDIVNLEVNGDFEEAHGNTIGYENTTIELEEGDKLTWSTEDEEYEFYRIKEVYGFEGEQVYTDEFLPRQPGEYRVETFTPVGDENISEVEEVELEPFKPEIQLTDNKVLNGTNVSTGFTAPGIDTSETETDIIEEDGEIVEHSHVIEDVSEDENTGEEMLKGDCPATEEPIEPLITEPISTGSELCNNLYKTVETNSPGDHNLEISIETEDGEKTGLQQEIEVLESKEIEPDMEKIGQEEGYTHMEVDSNSINHSIENSLNRSFKVPSRDLEHNYTGSVIYGDEEDITELNNGFEAGFKEVDITELEQFSLGKQEEKTSDQGLEFEKVFHAPNFAELKEFHSVVENNSIEDPVDFYGCSERDSEGECQSDWEKIEENLVGNNEIQASYEGEEEYESFAFGNEKPDDSDDTEEDSSDSSPSEPAPAPEPEPEPEPEIVTTQDMINISDIQGETDETMEFEIESDLLNSIDIRLDDSVEGSNIVIEENQNIESEGKVFKTGFDVDTEMHVSEAEIEFNVSENWIEDQNFDREDISLYRVSNGIEEIPTEYLEDKEELAYRAELDGFSRFGVGGEETCDVQEEQEAFEQETQSCQTFDTPCDVPENHTEVDSCEEWESELDTVQETFDVKAEDIDPELEDELQEAEEAIEKGEIQTADQILENISEEQGAESTNYIILIISGVLAVLTVLTLSMLYLKRKSRNEIVEELTQLTKEANGEMDKESLKMLEKANREAANKNYRAAADMLEKIKRRLTVENR